MTIDYESFAAECCRELQALQPAFRDKYQIDQYTRWDYNQYTGLLTFTDGGPELNFKYYKVGSFSEKSGTWMWAWRNDSTLPSVKATSEQIRDFGNAHRYEKLSEGYFEADALDAGDFTAIALHLCGGIGMYRPVSDGLQSYLVIKELIDNETARQLKDKIVACETHDYARQAFVCQHLVGNDKKIGFEEAFETWEGMELDVEDDLSAWCDSCEQERLREGEWNDTSMQYADIRLVCEACYFDIKEANLGHR